MPRITKTRALKVSLVGIVSVIVVESFAAIRTGSMALLSDSAHASFDALSTLILLVATSLSLKPADEDHTYGHGKFESLGALVGGIILLLLAIGIVALAAFRLSVGSAIHPSALGYAAAAYTIGIDILRIGVLTAALKTGSLSVRADLYHAISDFFSTSLVFVALGLASFGYLIGDTAISLVLAAMLGYLSTRLIHASILDLSDAVSGKLVQSIMGEIRKTVEVLKIKELRARRVGEVTYVDAVVAVSPFAGITDADTIASKIENNLGKLLGKSSILIHLEPLEWDVPLELKIRDATGKVEGARGLHNLSVTRIGNGLYVTLHVQVDPSLPLEKAHGIAESIERGIENSVPEVRQVTVHLEPSMAESARGALVDDRYVSEKIRSVIQGYPDVLQISAITIYTTGDKLHINVHCLFTGDAPISEIHTMISRIEEGIRQKINNAIVTIHPEPVRR
ncbi:MAG: cation-efflux pump [Candidatus Bathyarchaeia archaeon]